MSVSLVKGQKMDLTKGSDINNITFGLGWDVNKYSGSDTFDLDVAAFLLGDDGKVVDEPGFIYYGNKSHKSGCIVYSGDNLTGEGDGDDETMEVVISKIPENVSRIVFTATIYQARNRMQNFGMVSNAYIRAFDSNTKEEKMRFDLDEDFSTETAVIAGEMYRRNGEWKFNAIGQGVNGELGDVCAMYGVQTR